MKIKIRIAKENEIDEISELVRDEIFDELSIKEMKEWIRGSGWPSNPFVWWFVAERKGELVGCFRVAVHDLDCQEVVLLSSWIAIKSQYQHKGIGTQLWQRAIEIVKNYWQKRNKKIVSVITDTGIENKIAQNFYKKLGFKKVAFLSIWQEGKSIFFIKKLPPFYFSTIDRSMVLFTEILVYGKIKKIF